MKTHDFFENSQQYLLHKSVQDHQHLFIKTSLVAIIGALVVTALAVSEKTEALVAFLERLPFANPFFLVGKTFFAMTVLMLIWRIILVLRYRPVQPCDDIELPSCSVIVPAYNEGQQVLVTLRSLAASDYPQEKLQIIAVDDGSADDTWDWISAAARELRGRVVPVRLPFNQGKRHALFAGFQQSTGDVFVTVDSDSIVEPQTLRHLVSPFAKNSKVGAVAGNVRVLNRSEGLIPKMLDVIFFFSFDFVRASQSMVKTVMCTPGALSAYRGDIVRSILAEWLEQKFFGKPANIGEDRAMTNIILRNGFHVLFQGSAVVYTNVPTHYRNLCKMFLRWARSNVRESLVMCRFAFRRFRQDSMLGARINLAYHILGMARSQFIFLGTFMLFAWQPVILGSSILLGTLISSTLPAMLYGLRYRSSDAVWAYLYGLLWLFGLSWITPYALLTPHQTGWLTRQIVQQQPTPAATGTIPLGSVIVR